MASQNVEAQSMEAQSVRAQSMGAKCGGAKREDVKFGAQSVGRKVWSTKFVAQSVGEIYRVQSMGHKADKPFNYAISSYLQLVNTRGFNILFPSFK